MNQWSEKLEKFHKHFPHLDIRTDKLHRWLYATDASIYEIVPTGVAFPKNADEVQQLVQFAYQEGIPITPRGAGSGLCGGALGEGLVIDSFRYMQHILHIDPDQRTATVESGVVLDELNEALKPYGLMFGPDVATSSRATIGGMIANNSSGAFVHHYGVTIDHVLELEIVSSDGEIIHLKHDQPPSNLKFNPIKEYIIPVIPEIQQAFHSEIKKRYPGYALDRYIKTMNSPLPLLGGSEGTLAYITKATLNLVPIPKQRDLIVILFPTLSEAMDAIIPLLQFTPASIEHLDSVLFDQTRGKKAFQDVRELLQLDQIPCASMLFVEFFDTSPDIIQSIQRLKLGIKTFICNTAEERTRLWEFRKAGLNLLTGRVGSAKPATGIEDTAVRPTDLPQYVAELTDLLNRFNIQASFYGHASSGLLHVRPILDLHESTEIQKFRQIAEETFKLVKKWQGSFTAEHGVGIAHTEFIRQQVGDTIYNVFCEIKKLFDPNNIFNPGKIIDTQRYFFDQNLRWRKLQLPFEPFLCFEFKDKSFLGNLEQCNGCGACLKSLPTMCPTFIATHEEIMSTRGRANTIRHCIEISSNSYELSNSPELQSALKYCLSCRACTVECPSNVNMSLLKAELLYQTHSVSIPKIARIFIGYFDILAQYASIIPQIANYCLTSKLFRRCLELISGIVADRELPKFAQEPFHQWFYKTYQNWSTPPTSTGEKVIIFDDCFTRYQHPEIGKCAVQVLNACGVQVEIIPNRACCGRTAFSMGNLQRAKKLAEKNLSLFTTHQGYPILFLEPSCYSMFVEDYAEFKIPNSAELSQRSMLFEDFLLRLMKEHPERIPFKPTPKSIAIHTHCHAKATGNKSSTSALLSAIPNLHVTELPIACCGMAGAYGLLKDTYPISLELGNLLKKLIHQLHEETELVTSGTSCRQQIQFMTSKKAKHVTEILSDCLEK